MAGGQVLSMNSTQLRWGRVLVGGFLAELIVFAIVFPVLYLFGQRAFLASILHRLRSDAVHLCGMGEQGHRVALCAPWSTRWPCRCPDLHRLSVGSATAAAVQDRSRTQGRRWRGWRHGGVAPETSGPTRSAILAFKGARCRRVLRAATANADAATRIVDGDPDYGGHRGHRSLTCQRDSWGRWAELPRVGGTRASVRVAVGAAWLLLRAFCSGAIGLVRSYFA